jgi:DNA-binding XRE family transcriptional regulator
MKPYSTTQCQKEQIRLIYGEYKYTNIEIADMVGVSRLTVGYYTKDLQRSWAEKFWARVEIGSPDDCWLWQGCLGKDGYGVVGKGRGNQDYTHRVAYSLTYGKIPENTSILHKCQGGGNPACCNPNHLKPGTATENHKDMEEAGRMPIGESHVNSKLTESIVREIHRAYGKPRGSGMPKRADTRVTYGMLADRYGVTKQTVFDILHRRTWGWVEILEWDA